MRDRYMLFLQKKYDGLRRFLFMKKVNGSGQTFLKMSLLFCVLLFFLFSHMGESMTYAMSSNLFLTLATPKLTAKPTSKPTPQFTPRPTPEPTSKPTPRPTPQLTAKPTSKPTPQFTPRPTTPEPTSKPPSLPAQGGAQPRQASLTRLALPIHFPRF